MSAHKEQKINIKDLTFLQKVWKFLILEGFLAIPLEIKEEQASQKKSFLLSLPTVCKDEITSFQDGVTTIKNLQNFLFKNGQKISSLKWNYLGKPEEKAAYLSHLEDIFWENQTDEKIQALTNLREIVENPWLIINEVENLDLKVETPYEYFSPNTLTFLKKLEDSLSNWELNPYLICDEHASFHWEMLISDKYVIKGYIFNNGEGLKHYFLIDTI